MKWIIVILIILNAGWMFTDGLRALVIGDYLTPTNGEFAGQLGPWASILRSTGIEPRSTVVKSIFVLYGVAALTATVAFATDQPWGGSALIVISVLGLWYLPFGTAANILAIILLSLIRR